MLDRNLIGHVVGTGSVVVEPGLCRNYARAIGETDPSYFDVAAAKAAGLPSLRVPPTFLSCLQGQIFSTAKLLALTKMDLKRILHAEQGYEYFSPVYAGDTLTYEQTIADIYDKKGGALEFLATETRITNQDGRHVANLRGVVVQRQL